MNQSLHDKFDHEQHKLENNLIITEDKYSLFYFLFLILFYKERILIRKILLK